MCWAPHLLDPALASPAAAPPATAAPQLVRGRDSGRTALTHVSVISPPTNVYMVPVRSIRSIGGCIKDFQEKE